MMKNPFEIISPEHYAAASVVAREASMQMDSRLDLMILQPRVILDVGCGKAENSDWLKKRYPDAEVLAIDSVFTFMKEAQKRQGIQCLCADVYQLPLKSYNTDIVFANLLLPWCQDIKQLLLEWRRILKQNGLVMFTTLGPRTLQELRNKVPNEFLLNYYDMHDIGDVLIETKFNDPVLDLEYFTLTYKDQNQLFYELQMTGMMQQGVDLATISLDKNAQGLYQITYEIVYGHAWAPGAMQGYFADEGGEVRIPLSALKGIKKNEK